MRDLCSAAACAVLLSGLSLVATAAHADNPVEIEFGGATSTSVFQGETGTTTPNQIVTVPGDPNGSIYGGSNSTNVSFSASQATFLSGAASVGPLTNASSTSGVDAAITNLTSSPLTIKQFASTITAAGLGFYVQDRSSGAPTNGDPFTGYGETRAVSLSAFANGAADGTVLASAGFDFQIFGPTNGSNPLDNLLYDLSGQVNLVVQGGQVVVDDSGMADAAATLNDYTKKDDDPSAVTYNWDETDVTLALGTILGENAGTDLHYRATAYTISGPACIDNGAECLVAYSGFGDPVGRGGGVQDFAAFFRPSQAQSLPPLIDGISFTPQTVTPFDLTLVTQGVPEPATWALMIGGLGLMGTALRRRRSLSYS